MQFSDTFLCTHTSRALGGYCYLPALPHFTVTVFRFFRTRLFFAPLLCFTLAHTLGFCEFYHLVPRRVCPRPRRPGQGSRLVVAQGLLKFSSPMLFAFPCQFEGHQTLHYTHWGWGFFLWTNFRNFGHDSAPVILVCGRGHLRVVLRMAPPPSHTPKLSTRARGQPHSPTRNGVN